jgi:hypothetical protein
MNDVQIFQLTGISLTAMGIAWVINPKALRQLVKDMANNRGVLLLMGLLALIVGYLIIVVYTTNSSVIKLLGWISFFKGLVIVILSTSNIRFFTLLGRLKKYYVAMPWLVLFVGVVGLYLGYLA